MAEEASLALVDLLRQRNQTLDQQIQAVVRLNKRLEQQLDALHRESARKRRQLQRKIQEAQNALRLKDEDVRRLQRQLSEKIDAERARADKLEQLAADEAERRWTESVLRHLHTEPDGFDDGKRICDDPDTPKEMGKQNQKAQAVQSTCMASREEDVAITLAEMIPHLCGSWDNQEERGGNVDRLDFSSGPDQSVETDAYAGQVARQDQTQLLEEAREALSAHQETRWHDMMEREKASILADLFVPVLPSERGLGPQKL
ncbi:uncharacterized protein IUM83_11012 [Phytophthora cinnamomi]|uniref:uncharacterized protein n=1 Tax=Phytophthora cinnamomi TaxID=4785 RepID=UPI00355A8EA0|nr:hypothetical protein IUM83_11012 [Phytophthora cinnamomi]